ncbi:Rab3 GTPase-activating protein regulatory subunit N-terminus-domain-containing protein [Absidia repens]|uniref:Rab3 GTPase-activating protein regulatory subunit N-terminus-domain-containing protein n=1 Tax=Absidia repens TaxID=90262 RepID=A0A1X2IDP4_9FUNG|nr:Rab3 GTPase-activating protein regulatory subunit N-terminus-domain-containing protein [Absidia repens]
MTFKCRLEHHYRIPTPVLSILVGKLPKNTTTSPPITSTPTVVEDVTEHLASEENLKLSSQTDSWDKEWSWGLDEDKPYSTSPPPPPPTTSSSPSITLATPPSSTVPVNSTSSSPGPPQPMSETHSEVGNNTTLEQQQAPPIVKETYLVSASAAGKYIAMAYQRKFVVVALHPEQEEYIVIGQGSGCSSDQLRHGLPKERITSILCLPLFVPSTRKNQIFVMIGYSTGWLRVYSSTGTLLTAQLLESSPIISIKLRTPPPPPPPPTSTSAEQQLPTKQQKSKQYLQLNNHHYQDDEEITLLFENNRVVSIDGQSLWMVLRVCDGQRESGIDASKMQTAFTYKKWQLDQQEKVRDIISLGPSSPSSSSYGATYIGNGGNKIGTSWWWWRSPASTGSGSGSGGGDPIAAATAAALQSIFASSSSSSAATVSSTSALYQQQQQQQDQGLSEATSRYIGVGTHPMISFYATHETSRPYMSAVSMASYMVSRVATPVFSFAKSWWSGTSSSNNNNPSATFSDDTLSSSPSSSPASSLSSSPSQQHTPFVPDMPMPPQVIEQATAIPSLLHLSDPGRTIQSIVGAPPLQHSQHHTLAATSDALGRVILWDIQQGHMIRMWKGVRDAHCGWIQYEQKDHRQDVILPGSDKQSSQRRPHLLLFLVIYSARRGLLKIYQTRHGALIQQKPIGVFHVGPGWHLVACGHEPLGSSMVSSERKKAAMMLGEECGVLSTCLLISPHGEVRKITVCPS